MKDAVVSDGAPTPEQPTDSRLLLAVRREEGAVVLVLDGGEDLELAPESVPADLPPLGSVLGAELLAELRHAAQRKQAARLVFRILDRRLVSPANLRRRLAQEGLDVGAVDEVLAQMAERDLYSDRRFAEAWCREALLTRAVGRRYLERKLREKGVSAEVARDCSREALDPDTESELARRAAVARWKRQGGSPDRRAEAAVIRHLQGRGFDIGLAVRTARAMRPSATPDEEMT